MRKLQQAVRMQTTGINSAGERKAHGVERTAASNRIREIRQSGIVGGLAETLAMEKAKRARKAETPKQPSLYLSLSAPQFYPDRRNSSLTL